MNKKTTSLLRSRIGRIIAMLAVVVAGIAARPSFAEDWGAYALVPASAPALVLEAVGSGTSDGTVVSIGKPAGRANQKWVITPRGNNLYSIRPSYSSTLVLAASKGGAAIGHGHRARDRSRAAMAAVGDQEERGRNLLSHSQPCTRKGPRSSRRRPEAGGQDRLVDEPARGSPPGMDDQAPRRQRGTGERRGRDGPEHLCRARDQAGSRAQGPAQELHVFEQRDFPGHGAAGVRSSSRRSTTAPNPPASMSRPTAINPREQALAGNDDRHQGDARDHRRVRQAGRIARRR